VLHERAADDGARRGGRAITAPQTPIAPFSFSIGKVARSSASAVGWSIAPKTP